jgi:hypothetical protein
MMGVQNQLSARAYAGNITDGSRNRREREQYAAFLHAKRPRRLMGIVVSIIIGSAMAFLLISRPVPIRENFTGNGMADRLCIRLTLLSQDDK